MTAPNEVDTRKRNIETAMGSRLNKGVVAAHLDEQLSPPPENPNDSMKAYRTPRISGIEFSVRCDEFGNPIYQTIVPGTTEAKRGKLYERWNHPRDIFTARDGIIEIIEAYEEGGVQYEHRMAAVRQANSVDMRLQEGPIDPEERAKLTDETVQAMADAGYTSSVYPKRVETAQQLVKATELDILGRPNNSAGRMRVTSRRPQMIEDALVAGDVLKKNRRRLSVIEGVCDLIEVDFESLSRFANDLAELPIGTGAFDIELSKFRDVVGILLAPRRGRLPKPYSELGAKIRYALHATRTPDDGFVLARYMDPFEALDVAQQFSVGFNLLKSEEGDLRKDRIEQIRDLIGVDIAKIRERRARKSSEEEMLEVEKPKSKRTNATDRLWNEIEEAYGPGFSDES